MVFKETGKPLKYWKFGCGTMWHYVALYLCIKKKKNKKNIVFKEIGETSKY